MAAKVYRSAEAEDVEYGIVDETNVILTNFSRTVQSQKTEIRNAENDVCAVAYSGVTASIKLDGYLNGAVNYIVGALLTIANAIDTGGLSGGTVLVDQIDESTAQGEFKKVSVSATQYSETMTLAV